MPVLIDKGVGYALCCNGGEDTVEGDARRIRDSYKKCGKLMFLFDKKKLFEKRKLFPFY